MADHKIEAKTVLLLIDVINDLDFPGEEEIIKGVDGLAKTLKSLKADCSKARMPTIYLSDNYNNWHANFNELLEKCLADNSWKNSGQRIDSDQSRFLCPKADAF